MVTWPPPCFSRLQRLLVQAGIRKKSTTALRQETITSAHLGLQDKEVWVLPLADVSMYDPRAVHPYDEYVLKFAIQGLLNRSGPMVWLTADKFGWGEAIPVWQEIYANKYGFQYKSHPADLDAILRTFVKAFNGVMIYDRAPSVQMYLAMNLSSLNFTLPVSRRIYDRYAAAFADIPVVDTFEDPQPDRIAITKWMLDNILPLTDRTMALSSSGNYGDVKLGAEWALYMMNEDYAFYKKCFIFNMPCNPYPVRAYDYNVTGSPEDAVLFNQLMDSLQRPAMIMGWCEPEGVFVRRISQSGHFKVKTVVTANLSFHGQLKPTKPFPFEQDTQPRIAKPEAKVYLTIVDNEGDTVSQWLNYLRPNANAWSAPGRGQFPMNWALGPEIVRHFPAAMEALWDQRTPNDYVVYAPSLGGGYSNPDSWGPYTNEVLQFSYDQSKCVDLREADVWGADRYSLDAIADQMPNIRGLAVPPHHMPKQELFFVGTTRQVPVIRYREGHMYWFANKELFTDDGRFQQEAFRKYMQGIYREGNLPKFIPLYGTWTTMFADVSAAMQGLDPNKFEIVNYATMFHLAAQTSTPEVRIKPAPAMRHPWSNSLLAEQGIWTGGNGATAEVTSEGLKVALGTGDPKWGIMCLPAVQFPLHAKAVRMRISSSSPGARWIVKWTGDFFGTGQDDDYLLFDEASGTGDFVAIIPASIQKRLAQPLTQFQLGILGNPGTWVTYGGFEFLEKVDDSLYRKLDTRKRDAFSDKDLAY